MKKFSNLKIAIVHDSIRYFGGAERVLCAVHNLFPQADMYTSIISWDDLGAFHAAVKHMHITTSWVQHIPLFRKYPFLFRYFLPIIWRSFDLSSYDVIISLSGAQMSHLVHKKSNAIHICYCLTPPRHLFGYSTDFYWDRIWVVKQLCEMGNYALRKINEKSIRRVDYFIACSYEVARRIKKYYDRSSIIIYPPRDKPKDHIRSTKSGRYYVSISRLSRMKHVDVIIHAMNTLKAPLHIVGVGPEERYLRSIAGNTITFDGQLSDDELFDTYRGCRAVVCASEDEDFGIVPVEAMSFGKPVIAYYSGGYKETVIEGQTGKFFHTLSASSLVSVLKQFESESFKNIRDQKALLRFSTQTFNKKILHVVRTVVNDR